ncbi:MAG: hypothetical protein JNJ71_15755 [Rubrivivax sp.]|nr:hypothetical protein [Rubrivivax sp.]
MSLTLRSAPNRLLLGGVIMALCGGALAFAMSAEDAALGRALYDGQRALPAQLRGHDEALPAHAARCINCHEGSSAIAPALSARSLLQPQARRGGPPSHYDEASFCRLLRDGVDPAWVLLPREMPRYEIPAQDCRALWSYLLQR